MCRLYACALTICGHIYTCVYAVLCVHVGVCILHGINSHHMCIRLCRYLNQPLDLWFVVSAVHFALYLTSLSSMMLI